jgi:hypothetical protein
MAESKADSMVHSKAVPLVYLPAVEWVE